VISFYQSAGWFSFWCCVLLFSVGMSCFILRVKRLRGLYRPVLSSADIAVIRAVTLASVKSRGAK